MSLTSQCSLDSGSVVTVAIPLGIIRRASYGSKSSMHNFISIHVRHNIPVDRKIGRGVVRRRAIVRHRRQPVGSAADITGPARNRSIGGFRISILTNARETYALSTSAQ